MDRIADPGVIGVRDETMWIISFRRARERERKSYGKEA
jgi:uncharacterized DUF497 family protein